MDLHCLCAASCGAASPHVGYGWNPWESMGIHGNPAEPGVVAMFGVKLIAGVIQSFGIPSIKLLTRSAVSGEQLPPSDVVVGW